MSGEMQQATFSACCSHAPLLIAAGSPPRYRSQRPSRVMPTVIISYFSELIWSSTDSVDRQLTSCSVDAPPKRTQSLYRISGNLQKTAGHTTRTLIKIQYYNTTAAPKMQTKRKCTCPDGNYFLVYAHSGSKRRFIRSFVSAPPRHLSYNVGFQTGRFYILTA